MSSDILNIKNLEKYYENFTLKIDNLNVQKNSIVGFIGKNGAGKSTTIKCIVDLIPYDKGEIWIDNNKANTEKAKKYIAYVGDQSFFYNNVSCKRIYKFIKNFYDSWDDEKFNNIIKVFELDLSLKINQLSRGMNLKFNLALALAHNPKLLIMDEATAGLDPIIRNEILKLLKSECESNNLSIFFSSHITEDMIKIANLIYFIDRGHIVLSDYKENLLNYKLVEFNNEVPDSLKDIKYVIDKKRIIVDDTFKLECNDWVKNVTNLSIDEILELLIEGENLKC